MAWTTPKLDWDSGDAVTADQLNDMGNNLLYLKSHADTTTIHETSSEIRGDYDTPLILEKRTSDPESPAVGRMWIRTDL